MSQVLTFIIGCTGSGKGGLGRELARRTGGEIISIDSMKVYRRMDIGTAKPSLEVRRLIPHHLIDIVEPSEEFSVAEYVEHAERAILEIQSRRHPVFIVGGTPLYMKALSEGIFEGPSADPAIRARLTATAEREGRHALYEQLRCVDPVAAERIHPNDLRRLVRALEVYELTGKPISSLQAQWDRDQGDSLAPTLTGVGASARHDCVFIGLRREREDQSRRIKERVRRMIAEGLVDEVQSLLAERKPLSTAARQALGYAEIIQHLEGRYSLADAVEMIKINTRQFAKAQRTWFKRFAPVEWIDLPADADAADIADQLIVRRGSLWSP